MRQSSNHHLDYMARYGLARWLLRECVRANPLYVVSAALLAYGVLQLNTEIDPQIGKAGGIIAGLILLHVYEIAVLAAATVVLKQRTGGGRDLHGLMLVAALFLGGSFLALDELIAAWPWLGYVLIPAGLALAAIKMAWYARLPGILLPLRYRVVALLILSAHSISPLLGSHDVVQVLSLPVIQGLAWLPGWVSLLCLLWLVCVEKLAVAPLAEGPAPDVQPVSSEPDPLITRRCGACAIGMVTLTGVAHLLASDWVFDRLCDGARLYPALTVVAATIVLIRWLHRRAFNRWDMVLLTLPAFFLRQVAPEQAAPVEFQTWALIATPAFQLWLAAVIFYVALARGTGNAWFYAGLTAPLGMPAWDLLWKLRGAFRALLIASFGFALLIVGMVVSLYRECLLRWLEPRPPQAAIPGETK